MRPIGFALTICGYWLYRDPSVLPMLPTFIALLMGAYVATGGAVLFVIGGVK